MNGNGAADVPIRGFVLAGGQSRRMGTDKALISPDGVPLIQRAVNLLREAGVEAWIAGARAELSAFAPVVADREADQGTLAGICAALEETSAERALFLTVDMPLVPASLLSYMLRHALLTDSRVTLVSSSGKVHTFPAVVSQSVLPVLQAELRGPTRGCLQAFRAAAVAAQQEMAVLPVELLAQAGQVQSPVSLPSARWFLNVNTPGDLMQAAAWSGF